MTKDNIVIYGADWCDDSQRAKQFMEQHSIQFDWIDVEANKEAGELVENLNNGSRTTPTIVFQDGSVLVEPSNIELALKLGVTA